MSSPPASPTAQPRLSVDAIALAAERRSQTSQPRVSLAKEKQEHERRQEFRRLIDPGIIRRNPKATANAAIKTLSQIAENLLREPQNPKYQAFKPTNDIIKQRLVDPKGSLEYAIALGFRPEVKDFQPYYTFHPTPRRLEDLHMGAAILKEAIELEISKEERQKRSKVDEKAVAAEVAEKVKLAYMDDRKSKLLHDQREKELREARARKAELQQAEQANAPEPPEQPGHVGMPGRGHILAMEDEGVPSDEEDGMDDSD